MNARNCLILWAFTAFLFFLLIKPLDAAEIKPGIDGHMSFLIFTESFSEFNLIYEILLSTVQEMKSDSGSNNLEEHFLDCKSTIKRLDYIEGIVFTKIKMTEVWQDRFLENDEGFEDEPLSAIRGTFISLPSVINHIDSYCTTGDIKSLTMAEEELILANEKLEKAIADAAKPNALFE